MKPPSPIIEICLLLISLDHTAFGQPVEPRYANSADWLTYDRDNTSRRYSPLAEVDTQSVPRLQVSWAFQFVRLPTRTETTPLVRNGIMYLTVGGEEAYALDARTGRPLWNFNYAPPNPDGRRTNWNRGFALSGDRLFMATSDCSLLALDARNGSLLWRVQLGDPEDRYGTTAAPLIVRNLALLGVRGGDSGQVRGSIQAFDVETGRRVWKFDTVPAPGEPGSETWPANDSWKGGGAATWTIGSYDPELDLLYWPTGNPGPRDYDGSDRKGDNLYSCSLLALRPSTGKLVWHYQFSPHNLTDWDSNQPVVLIDAEWQGRPRKLIAQANRNAFFYVLDRTDGKLLLGKPFTTQTWARAVGADGRPELLPGVEPTSRGVKICPDVHGGTNWQASSYSPQTGLFYVVAREACGIYHKTGPRPDPDAAQPKHLLKALDLRTGEARWTFPFAGSGDETFAGAMSTAGGLVFFSTREGQFMAADAKSGTLLWHFNTGGTIRASPITYLVDGKQYVAIVSKSALFTFSLP